MDELIKILTGWKNQAAKVNRYFNPPKKVRPKTRAEKEQALDMSRKQAARSRAQPKVAPTVKKKTQADFERELAQRKGAAKKTSLRDFWPF